MKLTKPMLVLGIILAFILTVLAAFMAAGVLGGRGGEGNEGGQTLYFAAWLPILIVFIANRNKARHENLSMNRKLLIIGALALTTVLVITTLLLR